MAIGSTADIDYVLKDAGVAVTYGVQSTYGLLDRDTALPDGGESGFRFAGRAITLLIRDGSLTGLTQQTTIVVDSGNYRIRDIGVPETDGTRRLTLAEAAP